MKTKLFATVIQGLIYVLFVSDGRHSWAMKNPFRSTSKLQRLSKEEKRIEKNSSLHLRNGGTVWQCFEFQ